MRIPVILASLMLLSACSQKTDTAEAEKKPTFADPQIEAYDKAREVQGVMDAEELEKQQQMQEEGL